ncbi:MAG TPA: DUF488 family protein [Gemmatimonadaceae bacterium]|nr:DUF488 family protein [Gemmatimonadaceae bacterium]HXD48353.1 DUF488 family protein [Gemmatimonadaceae bacterium]
MAIRIVRLGSARAAGEGFRLGTVRRPPRGVKKADFSRLDYYDLWLPDLAPSAAVVSEAMSKEWTAARWAKFARRYRSEMRAPERQRLIALLAAMSWQSNFSVGCYCEDESRCHRSLLRELLVAAGGDVR